MHLIQHIRDESHNHAITGHRKKRQKAFTESGLEAIAGVGAKRRQALLKYLGGMQGVKSATLEEIVICTRNFQSLGGSNFCIRCRMGKLKLISL